jgi:peptidylprolyl isomerase
MRAGSRLAAAIASTLALGAHAAPQTLTEMLAASPAGDWRALDPANTLYMDLPAGRVVIELAPAYAPANVAAVRALVRDHYFDGASIVRVQDNYVVQWARPETDPRAKAMAGRTSKPEFFRAIDAKLPFTPLAYPDTYAPEVGFSDGFPVARDPKTKRTWLVHCYGSVGVGRDDAEDSGNGAELYAVIGQSPRNLDRNITLVGRVVEGIELLSTMPRGEGAMGFYADAAKYIPIRRVTLAADVAPSDRLAIQVLRTESATFRSVVESRANRREPWFKDPVGRIGVCNVPLPVRRITSGS